MSSKIDFSKIKNSVLKNLLLAAQKAGIEVKQVDPAFLTFCLQYKNKKHYLYFKKFGLNKTNNVLVANKYLTNKILKQIGLKTPMAFLARTKNDALRLIANKKLKYPFVIKPLSATWGIAVTSKIENQNDLAHALKEIKLYWQKNPKKRKVFIIEEYIEGNDYRLLALNNNVIATTWRKFPEIIGNGKKTIKNLIDQYYKQKNQKPIYDSEVLRNLKKEKMTLENILPKGQIIRLRHTANIHSGGLAVNVTNKVHPYYKQIVRKATKDLGINFCGVDLITKDISQKGNYAIIELNSSPSLSMHEKPDIGQPVSVSKLIFKSIFPDLK